MKDRTTIRRGTGAAALLAGLVLASQTAGAPRPPQDPGAFSVVRRALVQVGHGTPQGAVVTIQWLGSGFVVDRDCTVLTARHVLESSPREGLLVRLENPVRPGESLTLGARVLHEDPVKDLALLRFGEGPAGDIDCTAAGLHVLPLAVGFDGPALAGAAVIVGGFPVLEREMPREVPIVRLGAVASAEFQWEERPMLLLDLTGIPGFSGAPVVLRETGEAIGVIHGRGRTDREYDLEWATPVTREDLRQARAASRGGP